MAQCEEFLELLSARLDGELTHEEARMLEEHLAACPACRALGAQLAALHTALPELEPLSAPPDFARGVMARVRAAGGEKAKVVPLFRRPRVRALAGLAACALVCVGLLRTELFPLDGASGDGAFQTAVSAQDETSAQAKSVPSPAAAPAQEPQLYVAQPQEDGQKMDAEDGADGAQPPAWQYYYRSGHMTDTYRVGERTVDAVLTLAQLPDGAQDVLGAQVEWLADEEGRDFCVVTGEQMEALMVLAQEQGQDLTGAVTGRIAPEELCALVLEPGGAGIN